jgi:hypothetical protein
MFAAREGVVVVELVSAAVVAMRVWEAVDTGS